MNRRRMTHLDDMGERGMLKLMGPRSYPNQHHSMPHLGEMGERGILKLIGSSKPEEDRLLEGLVSGLLLGVLGTLLLGVVLKLRLLGVLLRLAPALLLLRPLSLLGVLLKGKAVAPECGVLMA